MPNCDSVNGGRPIARAGSLIAARSRLSDRPRRQSHRRQVAGYGYQVRFGEPNNPKRQATSLLQQAFLTS